MFLWKKKKKADVGLGNLQISKGGTNVSAQQIILYGKKQKKNISKKEHI